MKTDIEIREIFHFYFLEQLLKISDPKMYILKGGVNLRFYFNSPRYSEDMDLDVIVGSVATLKKNGYKVLNDEGFRRRLKTFGIEDLLINDPAKAKQTETTQRFRFRIVTEAGEQLPSKIEFSRRSKQKAHYHYQSERLDTDIGRKYRRLPFFCQHYTGETVLLQKIEALAGRIQTQTRDVFDIAILLLGGFDQNFSLSTLPRDLIKKAQENVLLLDYTDFEGHVLAYLEEEERDHYSNIDVWSDLQNRVLDFLTT